MTAKKADGLLVLADHKELYAREMERLAVPATISASVPEFLEILTGNPCQGLVLDIQKVMRSPRAERDRLFRVSESYPILRTKVDRSGKNILFLDDLDCFLHNCGTFCPDRKRCSLRYPVKLNAYVAGENDPGMLRASRGNILNISQSGCYVLTLEDLSAPRFVYLKVVELTDQTPIFGLVRWWRPWGEPGMLPGLGVVFMDIKPGQLGEIVDMCQDGTAMADEEAEADVEALTSRRRSG